MRLDPLKRAIEAAKQFLERETLAEMPLSVDLADLPEDLTTRRMPKQYHEELTPYNVKVVGSDAKQAVEIARRLEKGLSGTHDLCDIHSHVCKGNLGLPRHQMPQIEDKTALQELLDSKDPGDRAKGKAIQQTGGDPSSTSTILELFLRSLAESGVSIEKFKTPVGKLRATQEEIRADKTFGMAVNHLKGDFPDIGSAVVVSQDGYILDGHHRWAALLLIDPQREIQVQHVDLPMDTLLSRAAQFPGVYCAGFDGKPCGKKLQDQYKRSKKGSLGDISPDPWGMNWELSCGVWYWVNQQTGEDFCVQSQEGVYRLFYRSPDSPELLWSKPLSTDQEAFQLAHDLYDQMLSGFPTTQISGVWSKP